MKLVFATHNSHKAAEVARILEHSGIEIVTLADLGFEEDPPETQGTFEGNALQKARFVHERVDLPCVADDSGLAVDALDGAPGVYSKRFSPEATHEANNRLLLERMAGHATRTASFRCVIALVGMGDDRTAEGRCEGTVLHAPRGNGGFGYDPLFSPSEFPDRSMAELAPHEKDSISHRGRAFRLLPALLGLE